MQTNSPLSKSFLNHLLNYDSNLDNYDLFTENFLKKIGKLSPHHVTEDFIYIIDSDKIAAILQGYKDREDKSKVFSQDTKKALAARNFDI